MRKMMLVAGGLWAVAAGCFAADSQANEAGRKAEQTACVACHSLRLIDSQRLSAAAWGKEMDKMVGWGATVPDRQILLDYLTSEYSDAKPVPNPAISVGHR